MATIHFLNVGEGDSIVIQHNSGRVTMIDISCGNRTETDVIIEAMARSRSAGIIASNMLGNYRMAESPTKPQNYLKKLGVGSIFRFILTHPDMDHLDGFDALLDEYTVANFWYAGAKKEKPDFNGFGKYKEKDWDRYAKVLRDAEPSVTSLKVLHGKLFKYANEDDNGGGGDGLMILAPSKELIDDANESGDFNDCSYVLLYQTGGFKIIFSGDSHDATWEHILEHHSNLVSGCDVLIAPHHGRDSGRSWDFLDVLKPQLTLFGIANSDHLAYGAWTSRGLFKITNNQAGNVVLDVDGNVMNVYVENDTFARDASPNQFARNALNYKTIGYLNPKGN